MPYFVYLLQCSDNTLYCGVSNNLAKRVKEHNTSKTKASRYTRARRPVKLVYSEKYSTRSEAMQREAQLKRYTRPKKEALIRGDKVLLKKI